MTGYLPPGSTERLSGQAGGPLVVLQKPFAMERLVQALAQVVPPPAEDRRPAGAVAAAGVAAA
jgi:hypothetical protein